MTPDNIARLAGKLLQVKTQLVMTKGMPEDSRLFDYTRELEEDLVLYEALMAMVERDALAIETQRVVRMMMGESAASKLINPHGSLSTAYSEEP